MIPVSYNLRSLVVRKATTGATVLGLALVVFLLTGALMFSNGLRSALGKSARAEAAIVLRKGATAELRSSFDATLVPTVLSKPEVARDAAGSPRGVGELVAGIMLPRAGSDATAAVLVRGVPEASLALRGATIVAGRSARAGGDEAMVGAAIRGRFVGLDVGQVVELPNQHRLSIVGVFEDGGSAFESEVWGDLDRVRSAFALQGAVSAVRVQLSSPAAFDTFRASVADQSQGVLEAVREKDFSARQAGGMNLLIQAMALLIAVITCIGAMIGATITMHTSVSQRRREIATLRALGFSRLGILGSFLLESVSLALIGGSVGALGALALGHLRLAMNNSGSGAQIVLAFAATPSIVVGSLLAAGVIGVIGGFFPALRAARTNPVEAMRE